MKIGFGLILPSEVSNVVREFEIALMRATDSQAGLSQDPHITVKRPFEISNTDLDKFLVILSKLSQNLKPIKVSFNGIRAFGTSTIYVEIEPNQDLNNAHNYILNFLKQCGVEADLLDGENVVFHTTLAMNLTTDQYQQARAALESTAPFRNTFTVSEIGLFLHLESHDAWVVLSRFQLGS